MYPTTCMSPPPRKPTEHCYYHVMYLIPKHTLKNNRLDDNTRRSAITPNVTINQPINTTPT